MFKDRKDAGQKLAVELMKYKGISLVVLGIPRGGIEVGCEVARALKMPLSALIARKLPFPGNPEFGFGAIAEDGSTILIKRAKELLPDEAIENIKREQVGEIKRRIKVLRGGKPLPDLAKKIVILIDDGLAMGSTMLAAIKCCRNKKVAKVIVAVPISGEEAERLVKAAADETIVLEKPVYFSSVAQGYENWYDVSDEEAAEILRTCHPEE